MARPRRPRRAGSRVTSSALRTGRSMCGPSPRVNSSPTPSGSSDEQDVGEEDRGIHAELVDGLKRHLGRRRGVLAQLEEPVARAQRAVFRHVAAGLSHEPHGSERSGEAAARHGGTARWRRRSSRSERTVGYWRSQGSGVMIRAVERCDRCHASASTAHSQAHSLTAEASPWRFFPASRRFSRS